MSKRNKKTKTIKNKFINKNFHQKSEDKSFLIFGKNTVIEQIENDSEKIKILYIIDNIQKNSEIKKILELAKIKKIKIEYISSKTAFAKLGKVNAQGIMAQVSKYQYFNQLEWEIFVRKSKKKNLVLVLDKIEDVGNFGAMIRTAAAVGVSAIFISNNNQAPVNGTVFKTSAGNIFKVKIIRVSNINQVIKKLKELKFWIYAIDMSENKQKTNLWDQKFNTNTAFLLGSEGKGLSEKVKENSDFIISIPMVNQVESLNVSVSGAIVMYEWRRQQK